MLIPLFDRVALAQTTFFVRWVGRTIGVPALVSADLTLWRWFFFGLGLALVMLLRPEGLAGRRLRPVPIRDDPPGGAPPAPAPAQAPPRWLRHRGRGRATRARAVPHGP